MLDLQAHHGRPSIEQRLRSFRLWNAAVMLMVGITQDRHLHRHEGSRHAPPEKITRPQQDRDG
jgi:hypothetical protein